MNQEGNKKRGHWYRHCHPLFHPIAPWPLPYRPQRYLIKGLVRSALKILKLLKSYVWKFHCIQISGSASKTLQSSIRYLPNHLSGLVSALALRNRVILRIYHFWLESYLSFFTPTLLDREGAQLWVDFCSTCTRYFLFHFINKYSGLDVCCDQTLITKPIISFAMLQRWQFYKTCQSLSFSLILMHLITRMFT